MAWIWQHRDWHEFRFDEKELAGFENEFLLKTGMLYGAMRHINEDDKQAITIQLMSEEALKTSEIEGEVLDRESVQSSIQRQCGLKIPNKKISSAAQGISDMMVDVYAIIPVKSSLEETLLDRARHKAAKILGDVNHTMVLENQNLPQDEIKSELEDLANNLISKKARILWDEKP